MPSVIGIGNTPILLARWLAYVTNIFMVTNPASLAMFYNMQVLTNISLLAAEYIDLKQLTKILS